VSTCWMNGKVVTEDQARISVFDHGLLYGDGIFEGLRFYNRRVFRLQQHLRRLHHSAVAIGLILPCKLLELGTAMDELIQAYDGPDGYLRLVITRGEGPLSIDPLKCKRPNVFIIADRLDVISSDIRKYGAKLVIASTRRLSPDGLDPRIKSLNYLNHILAKMEANRAQADEAILLNEQGNVTEGTTDNVFIVKDNQLLTPQASDGVLEGVTRGVVLELADMLDIAVKQTTLSAYDLYTADECFLTGTAVELTPVNEIDGRELPLCPGPVFQKLQTAFVKTIADESCMDTQAVVNL